MSPPHFPSIRLAALLASALLWASAAAQTVYKSTLPDGKVIYSDQPAPGAVRVETLQRAPEDTGAKLATPEQEAAFARRQAERASRRSQAEAELAQAQDDLREAEADKAEGADPLPHEILGTVGGTRLSPLYFLRQRNLNERVDEARRRAEEAQKAYREAWGD